MYFLRINIKFGLFILILFICLNGISQVDSSLVYDENIVKLKFKKTDYISNATLSLSKFATGGYQIKFVCISDKKRIPHITILVEDSLKFTFIDDNSLLLNFPVSDTDYR
jgi:hypothetical protein